MRKSPTNQSSLQIGIVGTALFLTAGGLQAAPIVLLNDGFTDNGITNGADLFDTAWFRDAGASSIFTATDGTLTPPVSGNPTLRYTGAANNNAFSGNFTSQGLAVGDNIRLDVTYRTDGLGANRNVSSLAIGLYDSNGTLQTANGFATARSDDAGYFGVANVSSQPDTFRFQQIVSEVNNDTSYLTGGTLSFLPGATRGWNLNNINYHTLSLSITRTVSGLDLAFFADGHASTMAQGSVLRRHIRPNGP